MFRRGSRTIWAADPTAPVFDPTVQAQVANALAARSRWSAQDTAVALSTMRATRGAQLRATNGQQLVEFMASAAAYGLLYQRVRAEGMAPSPIIIRTLTRSARTRLSRAVGANWLTIANADATAAQVRAVARSTRSLAGTIGDSALSKLAIRVRATITTAAHVHFRVIPHAAFYPWPRDGVRDTSTVSVGVDKPAQVTLTVYAPSGSVLAHSSVQAGVGNTTLTWNGNDTAGATQAAGTYRYALALSDVTSQHRDVPGLGSFVIARDTIKPIVKAASATYVSGITTRFVRVEWTVVEPLSPSLKMQLVLRGPVTRWVNIPSSAVTGSQIVRVKLPKGTYHATLRVRDGSGNLTNHPSGDLTITK